MTSGLQVAVRPSNVKNILRGIEQLGVAVTPTDQGAPYTAGPVGAGWQGTKIYAVPTSNQIKNIGYPFFAVNRPRLAGYAEGGVPISMDAARGVMSTEPYWDFDVYAIHPYDPDNPNYDDATDDMNNLWKKFFENPFLQYDSPVQATPTPTVNAFAVAPGDGVRYAEYDSLNVGPQYSPMIEAVSGDIITLTQPLEYPPNPGDIASQGTCVNAYPYNAMPDYALLTDGFPMVVGFLTVRAFEQLRFDLN